MKWINARVDNDIKMDGIKMELRPMKTSAPTGQTVQFVCAYESLEKLQIDIEALPAGYATSTTLSVSNVTLEPAVQNVVDRFTLGRWRILSLVIDACHLQVKCRVTNSQGIVMGELTALIQQGFLSRDNHHKYSTL